MKPANTVPAGSSGGFFQFNSPVIGSPFALKGNAPLIVASNTTLSYPTIGRLVMGSDSGIATIGIGLAGVGNLMEGLLLSARNLRFEDGTETDFSRNIVQSVLQYGDEALEPLARMVHANWAGAEVASEVLRIIGRLKDSRSYEARFRILLEGLTSSDPKVRDGALLGLASMDDPTAIRYLRNAIGAKEFAESREDILQVLSQLEQAS